MMSVAEGLGLSVLFFSLSSMGGFKQKALTRCRSLDFELPASRTMRNKFLFFINHQSRVF